MLSSNFLNFVIGLNFMNVIINNVKFIKFIKSKNANECTQNYKCGKRASNCGLLLIEM